jgi:hypothetical protein
MATSTKTKKNETQPVEETPVEAQKGEETPSDEVVAAKLAPEPVRFRVPEDEFDTAIEATTDRPDGAKVFDTFPQVPPRPARPLRGADRPRLCDEEEGHLLLEA